MWFLFLVDPSAPSSGLADGTLYMIKQILAHIQNYMFVLSGLGAKQRQVLKIGYLSPYFSQKYPPKVPPRTSLSQIPPYPPKMTPLAYIYSLIRAFRVDFRPPTPPPPPPPPKYPKNDPHIQPETEPPLGGRILSYFSERMLRHASSFLVSRIHDRMIMAHKTFSFSHKKYFLTNNPSIKLSLIHHHSSI